MERVRKLCHSHRICRDVAGFACCGPRRPRDGQLVGKWLQLQAAGHTAVCGEGAGSAGGGGAAEEAVTGAASGLREGGARLVGQAAGADGAEALGNGDGIGALGGAGRLVAGGVGASVKPQDSSA